MPMVQGGWHVHQKGFGVTEEKSMKAVSEEESEKLIAEEVSEKQ